MSVKKPTEDEQNKYVTLCQADNDSEGCLTWVQWVSRAQKSWALNTIINKVIMAQGSAPCEVLKIVRDENSMCILFCNFCCN